MILNGIINNQISYFKYDIYIYPSLDCISFDIQWRTENFKNYFWNYCNMLWQNVFAWSNNGFNMMWISNMD